MSIIIEKIKKVFIKNRNECRLKRQNDVLLSGLVGVICNMILLKLAGTKGSVFEMFWYTGIKV